MFCGLRVTTILQVSTKAWNQKQQVSPRLSDSSIASVYKQRTGSPNCRPGEYDRGDVSEA